MLNETFKSIGEWATELFGDTTAIRGLARASEEFDELIEEATINGDQFRIGEEMVDVIIVLAHTAASLDIDLQSHIDRKMHINRTREWNIKGDGTGYHKKS